MLANLEPEKVFYYFEEISKIPHGSGNVEKISDYLADFAKERNLWYTQDQLKNVIIIKDATAGYEEEPAVILQGHMDMVAVKDDSCTLDMEKDSLELGVEGDYLFAKGTTLGGDDGIAVAYALAILDSDNIAHPRLEVIFTVDEETGMEGATGIDLGMLTGNRMINLDSEEEGCFLVSCAGGVRQTVSLPFVRNARKGRFYRIAVNGLLGGHSGEEIDKERANANCLVGRILWNLTRQLSVRLVNANGGVADNAIAASAQCVVNIDNDDEDMFLSIIKKTENEIKKEYETKDPGIAVFVEEVEERTADVVNYEDTKKVAGLLVGLPNGVQAMSHDVPGLVETSLNMGVMKTERDRFSVTMCVRSSIDSAKEALISKIEAIAMLSGGESALNGNYPGWQYRVDSPLRDKMIRVYERRYGKKPTVMAIHAGLECGILASKIKDLDCVSIGPDMKDIHTPKERLSISSTKRVWEFLLEILSEKN